MSFRLTKAQAEAVKREGVLAAFVRRGAGPFSAPSLSRSYALPVERVAEIIKRNGGEYVS